MKTYVIVFEYDSKKFLDVNKIIEFKKNLGVLKEDNKEVKLVFYGDASNEDIVTFMGYFNKLVGEKLCDISISFRNKCIIIESGVNNKSIKLSAKNAREIKNKNFNNLLAEYYPDILDMEVRLLPIKGWETLILDL